jgi:hypothetical protein
LTNTSSQIDAVKKESSLYTNAVKGSLLGELDMCRSSLETLQRASERGLAMSSAATVRLEALQNNLQALEARATLTSAAFLNVSIQHQLDQDAFLAFKDEVASQLQAIVSDKQLEDKVESLRVITLNKLNAIEAANEASASRSEVAVSSLRGEVDEVRRGVAQDKAQSASAMGDLRSAVELLTMDLDEGMERLDQTSRTSIAELRRAVDDSAYAVSSFAGDVKYLRSNLGDVKQNLVVQSNSFRKQMDETSAKAAASLQDAESRLQDDIVGKVSDAASAGEQRLLQVRNELESRQARQGEVVAESVANVMRTLQAENARNRKEVTVLLSTLERAVAKVDESVDDRVLAILHERSLRVRLGKGARKVRNRILRVSGSIKRFALKPFSREEDL